MQGDGQLKRLHACESACHTPVMLLKHPVQLHFRRWQHRISVLCFNVPPCTLTQAPVLHAGLAMHREAVLRKSALLTSVVLPERADMSSQPTLLLKGDGSIAPAPQKAGLARSSVRR